MIVSLAQSENFIAQAENVICTDPILLDSVVVNLLRVSGRGEDGESCTWLLRNQRIAPHFHRRMGSNEMLYCINFGGRRRDGAFPVGVGDIAGQA